MTNEINNNVQVILNKIDKLPELFHIAVKVAKMLDDINVDVNDLARVISLDQALTTQILKLCNSANYGFSRKIVSISDAIAKLGFKTLKSLVFMAISHGVLNQEVKGYDLGKGELWRNSVCCAVYAKHLAQTVGYPDPETAFTAGILRDIGKLMIHEYVGGAYEKIVRMVNVENITFSAAEERVLGFNHCQIGAAAAIKWNFPQILVDAIRYHHIPGEAVRANCQDVKLVALVHIADSLAMMLGSGIGSDGMMYTMDMKTFDLLNLNQYSGNLELLISEIFELHDEIESMVGMVNG